MNSGRPALMLLHPKEYWGYGNILITAVIHITKQSFYISWNEMLPEFKSLGG